MLRRRLAHSGADERADLHHQEEHGRDEPHVAQTEVDNDGQDGDGGLDRLERLLVVVPHGDDVRARPMPTHAALERTFRPFRRLRERDRWRSRHGPTTGNILETSKPRRRINGDASPRTMQTSFRVLRKRSGSAALVAPVNRRGIDAENLGRFDLVAGDHLEDAGEVPIFELVQRHRVLQQPRNRVRGPGRAERALDVFEARERLRGRHDQAFDQVLQLANVAGPVAAGQELERVGLEPSQHGTGRLLKAPAQKMIDEQRNVLAPLAQRRDPHP